MSEELKIKITAEVDKLKKGVESAKQAFAKFKEEKPRGRKIN